MSWFDDNEENYYTNEIRAFKAERGNKMTAVNGQVITKVRTGEVRLSYVHLFEAHAIDDGDAKYSVSLIIPKSDTKTINAINKAVKAAIEQGKTSKWNGKVPSGLKLPLRDADAEGKEDEAYADAYFVNANSSNKPGVVLNFRANGKFVEASPEDVYSGCYGIASVNFYPYSAKGSKGIACGLNNIMKVRDGDNLGGSVDADTDFADVEISEENYDDLLG